MEVYLREMEERLNLLKHSLVFAIRIDADGNDPFTGGLRSISIGANGQEPIDLLPESIKKFRDDIQQLLSTNALKVFFDAKHALKVLQRAGFQVQCPYFDVELADRLLNSTKTSETSLDSLAMKYDVIAESTIGKLLQLRDKLKQEILKSKIIDTAVLEFATIPAVVEMELTGILFNRGRWAQIQSGINGGEDYLKHIHMLTGRIHPNYNQLGTSTGRFSCKMPSVHGIPKPVRSCIVAPPGYCLVDADYSQQEPRILAEITGDRRLIADFQREDDIYKIMAASLLKKTVDEISESERQTAKMTVLALLYGSGDERLQQGLLSKGISFTLSQVRQIKGAFFAKYSKVGERYRQLKYINTNQVCSIGGRRRISDGDLSFPELCNSPIQATGADILKKALSLLPQALIGTSGKIIACVHDEILLQSKEDEAEHVSAILNANMLEAAQFFLKKVPSVVDVTILDNWQ